LTRRKGGVDDDDRVENSAVGFDATSRKSSSRESGQDCEVVYQTKLVDDGEMVVCGVGGVGVGGEEEKEEKG
jgi:hypothetical protein